MQRVFNRLKIQFKLRRLSTIGIALNTKASCQAGNITVVCLDNRIAFLFFTLLRFVFVFRRVRPKFFYTKANSFQKKMTVIFALNPDVLIVSRFLYFDIYYLRSQLLDKTKLVVC